MHDHPRISVVLPIFNAATTLPRALESIRRQTLTDWELVAVDDGSTDGTARLLAQAQQGDPRLRVVSLVHAGIAPALNAGIAAARAELIARMDADDESAPARLERLVQAFEEHPDAGLVASLVEYRGDREANAGYAAHVDWINSLQTARDIGLNRFVESPFAHPSVAFRRGVVARFGGYRDGAFPEDYELWLRWLEAGIVMHKVPEALLSWHDGAGRLSRSDPRYSADAFYRLKAVYLARWIRRHVAPDRAVWIWGAGRLTRRRVEFLEPHGVKPAAFLDIDEHKLGRTRAGVPVVAPALLATLAREARPFVIGYVGTRGARDLQRGFLRGLGWTEGEDFLFAA